MSAWEYGGIPGIKKRDITDVKTSESVMTVTEEAFDTCHSPSATQQLEKHVKGASRKKIIL